MEHLADLFKLLDALNLLLPRVAGAIVAIAGEKGMSDAEIDAEVDRLHLSNKTREDLILARTE